VYFGTGPQLEHARNNWEMEFPAASRNILISRLRGSGRVGEPRYRRTNDTAWPTAG
jgi:hypothetical protein